MKRICLLLVILFIAASMSIGYAAQLDKFTAKSENIVFDADILINGSAALENLSILNAKRPSFLNIDSACLTSSDIISQSESSYEDDGGKIVMRNSAFTGGAFLFAQNNGRAYFLSQYGEKVHQLISAYRHTLIDEGVLPFCLKKTAFDKAQEVLDAYGISTNRDFAQIFAISANQASMLQAQYDAMINGDLKKPSARSGDDKACYFMVFPISYEGLNVAQFGYILPNGGRGVDMSAIEVILSEDGIEYFDASNVYQKTSVQQTHNEMISVEAAVETLLDRFQKENMVEPITIYQIALEYVASPTGTGFDEYQLIPCWNFKAIPSEHLVADNEIDSALAKDYFTTCYCLCAVNGEWLV
jgi:hypothetical protein